MLDTETKLWRGALFAGVAMVATLAIVGTAAIVSINGDAHAPRTPPAPYQPSAAAEFDAEPFSGTPVERTKVLTVDNTANVEVRYSASVRHLFARCVNQTTGVSLFIVESDDADTSDGVGPYCDTCIAGETLPPLGTAYLRTSAGTASVACGFVEDWPAGASFSSGPGGGGVTAAACELAGGADCAMLDPGVTFNGGTASLTYAAGLLLDADAGAGNFFMGDDGSIYMQTAAAQPFSVFANGVMTLQGGTSVALETIAGNATVYTPATFAIDALSTTTTGSVTMGNAAADTVTSNASAWTFANDTTVALGGGANGLNIDSNTLVIDANSNEVGVGTSTPAYQFDVAGAAPISAVTSSSTSGAAVFRAQNNSGITLDFQMRNSAGGSGIVEASRALLIANNGMIFQVWNNATPYYKFYTQTSASSTTGTLRFMIGNTETVVNEDAADYDFRVESDTEPSAFVVDGQTTSKVNLEADGDVVAGTAEASTGVFRWLVAAVETLRFNASSQLLNPDATVNQGAVVFADTVMPDANGTRDLGAQNGGDPNPGENRAWNDLFVERIENPAASELQLNDDVEVVGNVIPEADGTRGLGDLVVLGAGGELRWNHVAAEIGIFLRDTGSVALDVVNAADGASSMMAQIGTTIANVSLDAGTAFLSFGTDCDTTGATAGECAQTAGEIDFAGAASGVRYRGTAADVAAVTFGGFDATWQSATPGALPTCDASHLGWLVPKTDTDSTAAGSETVLCFCKKDDAAATFSWQEVFTSAGTCS